MEYSTQENVEELSSENKQNIILSESMSNIKTVQYLGCQYKLLKNYDMAILKENKLQVKKSIKAGIRMSFGLNAQFFIFGITF